MRILFSVLAVSFSIWHLAFSIPILASSPQAYQDYLYQFDVYRATYNEFSVAKNEYLKFKTLTSQSTALEKTIAMMAQRDFLIKSYLFLLNEKLNENAGMGNYEKELYRKLITNEVTFLVRHSKLVDSIGSLEDASNVSKQLESHYTILQTSIRQTIAGIGLGGLTVLARQFDDAVRNAQILVNTNRASYTLAKQETIDRWLLQIANKRSLYQQKIDTINQTNAQLKGSSTQELDMRFSKIQKDIAEARQYLAEGTSFLGELTDTMRFAD